MLRKILLKKSKGFTLMELVIVMVIVGVLAAISVPMYTSYVKKAYASEAHALCDAIATAEKVWFAENGTYVVAANAVANGASVRVGAVGGIAIDTSSNKYFTTWAVAAGATGIGNSFVITVTAPSPIRGVANPALGVSVTYTLNAGVAPIVVTSGL